MNTQTRITTIIKRLATVALLMLSYALANAAISLPADFFEIGSEEGVTKYSWRVPGSLGEGVKTMPAGASTLTDVTSGQGFLYMNLDGDRNYSSKSFDLTGEHFTKRFELKNTDCIGFRVAAGKKALVRVIFSVSGRMMKLAQSETFTKDQAIVASQMGDDDGAELFYACEGGTSGQNYWVTGQSGSGAYITAIDIFVYDSWSLYSDNETYIIDSMSKLVGDTWTHTKGFVLHGVMPGNDKWLSIPDFGVFLYSVPAAYQDKIAVDSEGNLTILSKFETVEVTVSIPAGWVYQDNQYWFHPSLSRNLTITMPNDALLYTIQESTSLITDGSVLYDGATNTAIPTFIVKDESDNDVSSQVTLSFTLLTPTYYDDDEDEYMINVGNGWASVPSGYSDAAFPVKVSCSSTSGTVLCRDLTYTLKCLTPLRLSWVIAPWAKCKVGSENNKMYNSLKRTQNYKSDFTFSGLAEGSYATHTITDNNTLKYTDGWADAAQGAMLAQKMHVADGGDYSIRLRIKANSTTSETNNKILVKLFTDNAGNGPTQEITLNSNFGWTAYNVDFANVNSGTTSCAVGLQVANENAYKGELEVEWVQFSQRYNGNVGGDYYLSTARVGKFAYYLYNVNSLCKVSYKRWYQGDKVPSSWNANAYGDRNYGDELEVPAPTNFDNNTRKEGYLLVKIEKEGMKPWYGTFTFNFLKAPTISADYAADQKSAEIDLTKNYGWNAYSELYYSKDGSDPGSPLGTSNVYTKDDTYTTENVMFYGAERYKCGVRFYTQPRKPDDTFDSSYTSDEFYIASEACPVQFQDNRTFFVEGDSDRDNWTFGYSPRSGADNTDNATNYTEGATGNFSIHTLRARTLEATDKRSEYMKVMFGTTGVPILYQNQFSQGAMKWESNYTDQDNGFDEFIDVFTHVVKGKENGGNGNANPYTEYYGGIGTSHTEDGGFFLQPVSGDFLRFEPQYDGVVTLWIRQNGATQSSTRTTGELPRRPVYVVDENGKIMRRTTNRPTVDSYYCVNGVFANINSSRSVFRNDFEETWRVGLEHWKDLSIDTRNAYHLYEDWYKFNFEESLGSTQDDTTDDEVNIDNSKQVSRYDYVQTLIYRSDNLASREASFSKTVKYNGSDITSSWDITPKFAKYGYEAPNYNYSRYRIPVKAGKTYYVGGRTTKNGFVGVKFEPLECNINPDMYLKTGENYRISESFDIRYPNGTGAGAPTGITAQTAVSNGTFATTGRDYNRVFKTYGINNDDNYGINLSTYGLTQIATNHLYEDPQDSESNDWITNTALTTWSSATGDTDTSRNGAYPRSQYATKGNQEVGTTMHVILHRTFENGKWYPIVLPFSVSESRMRELFGAGVKVLYLDPVCSTVAKSAVDEVNCKLTFTRHYYQMLYANMPAFICPDLSEPIYQVDFGFVTLEKTNLRQDGTIGYDISSGYEVVGSYNPVTPTREMYYLSNEQINGSNRTLLYHAKAGNAPRMKGTRVWIQKKPASSAPPLMTLGFSTFDGADLDNAQESGITDIVADDDVIERYNDNNVYDLMGRIVGAGSTDNLPKGVYIFKGKKVYVR